jgi:hypothetical protein
MIATQQRRLSQDRLPLDLNNGLKIMCKEVVVAYFNTLFRNFPRGTETLQEKSQIGSQTPEMVIEILIFGTKNQERELTGRNIGYPH